MHNLLPILQHYWWVAALVVLLACYKLVLRLFGVIIIDENSIGIVNKKFVLFGKNKTLPDGAIIALNGEAGNQVDTLAPGLHFFLWPWQFEVTIQKHITIQDGKIGVVSSKDGKPLSAGRVLGRLVECDSYQNARLFLTNGGERGSQLTIIPPGTYRINTALFTIQTADITQVPENKIGIVTTKEGTALRTGDIAGKEINGHNMFQDPQTFINNGGTKGMQEQVIMSGRYFINPLFASIEMVNMTSVPIAHVGVVVSYVGENGIDVTGDKLEHGNLVPKGQKGVWVEPLDPGKYPVNPYTHKVECVPTANVVLNWADQKTESHNLDKELCTITVRSSDGFKFNLDVSQIIHIPRTDAPMVIARFGNMQSMVTQVLEPTIGNYFRNAAQSSSVIEFLNQRKERQAEAFNQITAGLQKYNVRSVDTLIGDIVPPEPLMKPLTDRKIAEEENTTYKTQITAQETRQQLEQATAKANTQARVVDAERNVTIAEYDAQSSIKKAEGDAKSKTVIATADAEVIRVVSTAEAEKIASIGAAEADVIKQKIASIGPENYKSIEVTRALSTSGQKLVPEIISGAGGSSDTLVSMILADKLKSKV